MFAIPLHSRNRAPGSLALPRILAAECVGLVLLLCSSAMSASQIEVEHADWGFDDRAVPRRFNLLTVGLTNISSEPFEGTIELRRLQNAAGAWAGAPHSVPVYLAPYAKRIVQFYPYVLDDSEEWELRWGDELEESYVTELAPLCPGARVILNDPLRASGIVAGLRGFREDLFPTSVIGTDGLMMIVMDHMPKWESARKTAFRDWLYRGGVLHVLRGPDREFPQLPIAELNAGKQPTAFGAGRIHWHDFDRSRFSREFIHAEFFPTAMPLVDVVDFSGFSFGIDPTSPEFIKKENVGRYFRSYAEWNSDELIPMQLRNLIRTAHNWPLIYTLSILYLLLLFPGGPLLARSNVDYRLGLVALVVAVSTFTGLFALVGARGFGESTVTHSLSIIRPLPDGRWDVEQWGSLFVTSGGDYTITHTGEQSAYSTAQNLEMFDDAMIESGSRPRMTFDIPPYTYRTFVRRSVVSMPALSFDVQDCRRSPARLKSMKLKVAGALPANVESSMLWYADQLYQVDPDQLKNDGNIVGEANPVSFYLGLGAEFHQLQSDVSEGTDAVYAKLDQWMLARQVGVRLRTDSGKLRLPDDRARLFLYARVPEELATRDGENPDQALGAQHGRALYTFDLMLPDRGLLEHHQLFGPESDAPSLNRNLNE